MLRRVLPIIFLLMFSFLLVLPVFAQDVTPEVTATDAPVVTVTPAPVDPPVEPTPLSWLQQISPWVGGIAIVALIVVGVLGRTFIVQLGASVPVAFYEIGKGAAGAGLGSLGEYVTGTLTTIDDAAYAELRKQYAELVKQIDELRAAQVHTANLINSARS